jgi:hypothetical protein
MTGETNGSTSGGAQFGQLRWDNVEGNFILSDRTFTVTLENIPRFNEGQGQLSPGKENGRIVHATITQHIGGPSPSGQCPTPAALPCSSASAFSQ